MLRLGCRILALFARVWFLINERDRFPAEPIPRALMRDRHFFARDEERLFFYGPLFPPAALQNAF
jgi:hypothetical protein